MIDHETYSVSILRRTGLSKSARCRKGRAAHDIRYIEQDSFNWQLRVSRSCNLDMPCSLNQTVNKAVECKKVTVSNKE